MGRNAMADLCHLLQFTATLIVLFEGCQFFQFQGMAFGVIHDSMGSDLHGFEFFQLVVGGRIVQRIDVGPALLYVLQDVQHAFLKQFIACHSMAGSPLFHKFRKDARLISVQPFGTHALHNPVAVATSLPKWNDEVFVGFSGLFIHAEPDFFSGIENIKILQRVHIDFGIGGSCLGGWSSFTYNQFLVVDADAFVSQNILQRLCTLNWHRVSKSQVFAVEFSNQQSSFGINAVDSLQAFPAKLFNTFGHHKTNRIIVTHRFLFQIRPAQIAPLSLLNSSWADFAAN